MRERESAQLSFADTGVSQLGGKRTQALLNQLDAAIDWESLAKPVRAVYRNADGGAPAEPVVMMIKIVLLQKWFNLCDPQAKEQLNDRVSFRRFTTCCWLVAACLGPQTDLQKLTDFCRTVHPAGPGWGKIRAAAGISAASARADEDNISLALLGWVGGCTMIWSALFTVGNFLYGRTGIALSLLLICLISGTTTFLVIRRLWTSRKTADPKPATVSAVK